ncbi:MAG: hypothetical protein RIC16_12190 [Rhodospirillales bacterium]
MTAVRRLSSVFLIVSVSVMLGGCAADSLWRTVFETGKRVCEQARSCDTEE